MMKLTILSPHDKLTEIRRLYFAATKHTIGDDLARAVQLLKSMDTEEERERATVYMDGLAQMRSDWAREARPKGGPASPKPSRDANPKARGSAGGASDAPAGSGPAGMRGRAGRAPGGGRGHSAGGGNTGRAPARAPRPKGPRR